MNLSTHFATKSAGDAAHAAARHDDHNDAAAASAEASADFAALLAGMWFASPIATVTATAPAEVNDAAAASNAGSAFDGSACHGSTPATQAFISAPDGQAALPTTNIAPVSSFRPDESPPLPALNLEDSDGAGDLASLLATLRATLDQVQSEDDLNAAQKPFANVSTNLATYVSVTGDAATSAARVDSSDASEIGAGTLAGTLDSHNSEAVNVLFAPSSVADPRLPLQPHEIALLAARNALSADASTFNSRSGVRAVNDALAQFDADAKQGNAHGQENAGGATFIQPLAAATAQVTSEATTQAARVLSQTVSQLLALADKQTPRSVKTLRIRLNPEELGRVEVQLSTDAAGRLHARLSATRETARETLADNLHHLRQTLERAGLPIESLEVSPFAADSSQTGARSRHSPSQPQTGASVAPRGNSHQSPTSNLIAADGSRDLSPRLLNLRA